METINYKNVSLVAWDVGGRDKIVSLFTHKITSLLSLLVLCIHTASIMASLLPAD